MHHSENTILRLIRLMRRRSQAANEQKSVQKGYFLLYYERLLALCEGAVSLSRQSETSAPPAVLLRSALECSIDLYNLASFPEYHYVVRAVELHDRDALFRYKAKPLYARLEKELGEEGLRTLEEESARKSREALEQAGRYFPSLDAPHKLNVINRFRIAGKEELYQTDYTLLSATAHNALGDLAIEKALSLHLPLDRLLDERLCSTCLGLLVDAIRCSAALFGPDEQLLTNAIGMLKELKAIPPRALP
ncbi:MAG: DUF5677 domain-containing protein [Christensenellaceae bacterium]|jgi:hypothetical protein|nr:DUF5677 domain-containing protein [Christensenellaceae bacterium]